MVAYSMIDRRPKMRTADVPGGDDLERQLGPPPEESETSFPPLSSLCPSASVIELASGSFPASTLSNTLSTKVTGMNTLIVAISST